MPQPVDLFRWRSAILSEHGPANPLARLVLIAVSIRMKADGSGSWEAQETIATRARVGLRSVKRHLEISERTGWVERQRVRIPGRTWRGTTYSACVPDDVYWQLPERPWESDPMFRKGATVAPSYTGKANKVPTDAELGANGAELGANDDTNKVPQLGPLILHRTLQRNSSKEGALARTALTKVSDEKAEEETEEQRVERKLQKIVELLRAGFSDQQCIRCTRTLSTTQADVDAAKEWRKRNEF